MKQISKGKGNKNINFCKILNGNTKIEVQRFTESLYSPRHSITYFLPERFRFVARDQVHKQNLSLPEATKALGVNNITGEVIKELSASSLNVLLHNVIVLIPLKTYN